MEEARRHTYLGSNFSDYRGREVLLPDHTYEIYIITLSYLVLLPNETLPLRSASNFQVIELMLNSGMSRTTPIGIMWLEKYHMSQNKEGLIGTIGEIRYTSTNQIAILKGRERFKIISTRKSDSYTLATVVILPEYNLVSNANGYLPYTMKHRVGNANMFSNDGRRFPKWVYEKFSTDKLVIKTYNQFTSLSTYLNCDDQNLSNTAFSNVSSALLDPVGFSYYLSSNIATDLTKKIEFLETVNVAERLRLLSTYMEATNMNSLCCSECNYEIVSKAKIFVVPGAEGTVGAYVNPHGAVHETMTFKSIIPGRCLLLHGLPSSEDSWFPGFEWTIVSCSQCYNHLGWLFTSTDIRNEGSSPLLLDILLQSNYTRVYLENSSSGDNTKFWGFRRAALTGHAA